MKNKTEPWGYAHLLKRIHDLTLENRLLITISQELREAFCDAECRMIATQREQTGYHDKLCYMARAALAKLDKEEQQK